MEQSGNLESADNISVSPLFIDEDLRDFHLVPTVNAALDAGTRRRRRHVDFDANPRTGPITTGPDEL